MLDISIIRLDGGTQPRAELMPALVSEYAAEMSMGVAFPPVVVFYDGLEYWLADGFHRVNAAKENGSAEILADIHQGSQRDAKLFSFSANGAHGARRANADKRRAVDAMLADAEWSRWTDGTIARHCAVTQQMVSFVRSSDTHKRCEYPIPETRTFIHPKTGRETEMDISKIGKRPEVEAPSAPEEPDEPISDILLRTLQEPETPFNHRAQYSGDFEWYTPSVYVDAARDVMGSIDLDPASCEFANRTVNASRFFSIEDDGLTQEWTGNVWLNPPYSQPDIAHFMAKMVEENGNGNATNIIALTHNSSDTAWFHLAAKHASALCFTRGRIKFVSPTKESASPTQGQTFFYFGKEVGRFGRIFGELGLVVAPYHE